MDKNVKEFISGLVLVSTFAKQSNRSPMAIYSRIKKGKLSVIEIDGVKFIDTNNK